MGEEAGLALVSGHHRGHPGPVLGEEQPRDRGDPARAWPGEVAACDTNLEILAIVYIIHSASHSQFPAGRRREWVSKSRVVTGQK